MEILYSFAFADMLGKPLWVWLTFAGVVVALLVFDLGLFNRKDHVMGVGESLRLSAFYIGAGALFGAWVWWWMGQTAGVSFFTGFLIEKSLSLDNVFVISLIFATFAIPREYQHRVLFWGILGVVLLRGIMIGAGTALVHNFEWVLWVFGAFLLLTGVKMLFSSHDAAPDIAANPVLRLARRVLRVSKTLHGHKFFVREPAEDGSGRRVLTATPLFLALVMVESADVIFAVDSVPAIFAITTDPYIVYTSNIFAILGLRALYFALAAMIHRFHYLKYALSIVLIFIGGKIIYTQLYGKVDPALSLAVTAALLAGGVVVSLIKSRNELPTPAEALVESSASGENRP